MNLAASTGIAYDLFLHDINHVLMGVRVKHFRVEYKRALPYLKDEFFDIIFIDESSGYLS